MSYFDVFGFIFEKSAMTDLPNIIVSMCLVSYNFCMIPQVCSLTFWLNLSGAWGDVRILGQFLLYIGIKASVYNMYSVYLRRVLISSISFLDREDRVFPDGDVPGAGGADSGALQGAAGPGPGPALARWDGVLIMHANYSSVIDKCLSLMSAINTN